MLQRKRWRELVGEKDWLHLARILFLPGRPVRLHTHDFPEVFWIMRGEARHHINGVVKRLDAGDLVFVRPEDRHKLEAVDNAGFLLVNLAYHPHVRNDLLRRFPGEFRPVLAPESELPFRAKLGPTSAEHLMHAVDALGRADTRRLALEHFLLGLPAQIRPVAREFPAMPDWLRRACEEAYRPEVFSRGTRGLAKAAGRSPEHVARSIRTHLGLSPSDFINQVRLEYAARELRLTSRSIADIALDCGLNNLSHFYGLFRRAFRQTPRAYRIASLRPVV